MLYQIASIMLYIWSKGTPYFNKMIHYEKRQKKKSQKSYVFLVIPNLAEMTFFYIYIEAKYSVMGEAVDELGRNNRF